MKIDNETEEEIDYNQTGGGGGDDVPGTPASIVSTLDGTLPPGAEVMFTPEGPSSYVVTLRGASGGCCQVTFSDSSTHIVVRDPATCDVTVTPEPMPPYTGPC